MRAGRLDRIVTIQRYSVTQSNSGEQRETWTTLDLRRRASIWTPQAGAEAFRDPQLIAMEKVEWLIRWSSNVAALTPKDRIIYPALAVAGDTPSENAIYDIVEVHEYERRDGLRIVTARRPDAS